MKNLSIFILLLLGALALHARPTHLDGGGSGAVKDVNGQTGHVSLNYTQVGAQKAGDYANGITTGTWPSDSMTFAGDNFPTYSLTMTADHALSIDSGHTPQVGEGIVIDPLIVTGSTHSLTTNFPVYYNNGASSANLNIALPVGRYLVEFWTPNGTDFEARVSFYGAGDLPVAFTPANYSPAAANAEQHFVAIDTALGAYKDKALAFTGKTYDAGATGNVLKYTDDAQFFCPEWSDGAGAVIVTTAGPGVGHATFSGTAAKTVNYVIYRWIVPKYFDTAAAMTCVFNQMLTATDTAKQAYEISMADVTSSASSVAPTFSNAIPINFPVDASGAANDLEQSPETTLTSWAPSLTAGHIVLIKMARVGDDGTNDTSSVASEDVNLTLYYGVSK